MWFCAYKLGYQICLVFWFQMSLLSNGAHEAVDPSKRCPVCLDDFDDPQSLPCRHQMCRDCLTQVRVTLKSHQCPVCRVPFATAEGSQPRGGTMSTSRGNSSLPGYPGCGTIIVYYNIPGGIQGVSVTGVALLTIMDLKQFNDKNQLWLL